LAGVAGTCGAGHGRSDLGDAHRSLNSIPKLLGVFEQLDGIAPGVEVHPAWVGSGLKCGRQIEVHYDRCMVAAYRNALLVEVFDVPHNPMAANPDRIEAPSRARRVLAPPSPVADGKGAVWVTGPQAVHLIGMTGEPAAQRVRESVLFVGAEQNVISKVPVQASVSGVPMRPGLGEVG